MRKRDRIGTWVRDARAQRAVGVGNVCATCGEARPFALIRRRVPPRCFRCDRIACGSSLYDRNHPFGEQNSPIMILVPVNDHRAVLSVAQYRWPSETLENPLSDPFLAAAARFRGLYDNFEYMLADRVKEAEHYEQLSAQMRRKYGDLWWCEQPRESKPRKPKAKRKA